VIGDLFSFLTTAANFSGENGIPNRLLQHLEYCLLALLIAAAVAIPLGLFVGHTGRGGLVLVGTSNAVRALPTLGLVTFLFLVVPEATVASTIGLVVLAIPPILAGTYSGVSAVDSGVLDAARGMGMTGAQRLWQVELPNSLPLLLGGIRNAMLQLVATAAVAAYIGLGGLGRFVFDGLAIYDYAAVATGALLTALLAIVLDLLFAALQRWVVPTGLRLVAAAGKQKAVRPAAAGGAV
jgi:osmoprotectant transport system permease protein